MFSKFANTTEINLNDAYVGVMRALANLSVFAEKSDDSKRVWHIFAKKAKCDDIETAKKEFSKAVKKFKTAVKASEEEFESLGL